MILRSCPTTKYAKTPAYWTVLILALALHSSPIYAVRQMTPVVVDGSITDIDRLDSSSQAATPHSAASPDLDLLHVRVANDDQYLFLGVACRLPADPTAHGLLILIDGRPDGTSTLHTASIKDAPALLRALDGTVLEEGFRADHALTLTPDHGRFYELHLTELVSGRVHSVGLLAFTTQPIQLLPVGIGEVAALRGAFDPREEYLPDQANLATRGLELAIPLELLRGPFYNENNPADRPIQVFVASVQASPPYWSNHTLPPSVAPGDRLPVGGAPGAQPNFAANLRGALPRSNLPAKTTDPTPPLVGFQGLSAALPVGLFQFSLD